MNINYNTDRLIVINYPIGAGGKFISLCLAIAEQVLHQDRYLANKKISKAMDQKQSYHISKMVINKSGKSKGHFELGCYEFAGFNANTKQNQETLANDIWRYCTNQSKYYFCMMNNARTNSWSEYTNAKHILLKNFDWLLEKRKLTVPENYEKDSFNDPIEFDMKHCLDAESFLVSINGVMKKLGLETLDPSLLEDLRRCFLDKCEIGFQSNDKT